MSDANVYRADFEYDDEAPNGFRSGMAPLGRLAGGRAIAMKLFELPPGESICPYHYEYEEEWLIVIEGEVSVRQPHQTEDFGPGSVICFPAGPDGAHRVTNRSREPARVLMFSSAREPAVAVYPDSDKIGVWPGTEADHIIVHRADGNVDYWEGEEG